MYVGVMVHVFIYSEVGGRLKPCKEANVTLNVEITY